MASVSTYLNFMGNTEEAFDFYRSVFKTEFKGPIMRMKDVPPGPGMPELREDEKNMVMHVELPILGGHVLMATDCVPSMGQTVNFGNNFSINLQPDTRAETEQLFAGLAQGGRVNMPLTDMFWGDYFGVLVDKFGVQWMFNCSEKASTK